MAGVKQQHPFVSLLFSLSIQTEAHKCYVLLLITRTGSNLQKFNSYLSRNLRL